MQTAQIGVYGLGTMGSALALNLAENGFRVAVTNRETNWIAPFIDTAGPLAPNLRPSETLANFVASLGRPRTILLMIPAGPPIDAMIAQLRPLLDPDDMIIDAGNSDFHDTRRRSTELAQTGLHFTGIGVSGGADGARHGPSMMVGGSPAGWTRLQPMLDAIAARFRGDPCVAHVGPDGAGHFVKTLHNGIEYADMQMIAEIYGLLRDGAGWGAGRIGAQFADWNEGPLASFLIQISATVLRVADPDTGQPLVDLIRDAAGQKGTGRWTVIEALRLGQSASAIEAAIGARAWSSEKSVREFAEDLTARAPQTAPSPATALSPRTTTSPPADLPDPDNLARALLAGRILSHAQGFRILLTASDEYHWALDLARIAEIWRAGCIIRSALLDDLATALRDDPPHGHLILAPALHAELTRCMPALRQVVASAALAGLPVPSLAASLGWYDSMTRARGTTNLIQAQRDFFGAHGFERTDKTGQFHGTWS
ncbi:MAG: 6-phosphogluconate dehydrogenase [Paracoccaceae bacterium]|jgi:6-phosphogluconate dehydrogenase